MNALDLLAALHGILGSLVGANGLSINVMSTWAIVLVTAVSDEATQTLGAMLDLREPVVRSATDADGNERWWLLATADPAGTNARVQVSGPHHAGPAPGLEGAT